jgi:hemoglobin
VKEKMLMSASLQPMSGSEIVNESINYIFLDVAKIDLEHHLPILADFWEQVMFHTGSYRNNPLQIHLNLNAKEKLTEEHFDTWLKHFYSTTDSLFAGQNAENIKTKALSIATIMKIKMQTL